MKGGKQTKFSKETSTQEYNSISDKFGDSWHTMFYLPIKIDPFQKKWIFNCDKSVDRKSVLNARIEIISAMQKDCSKGNLSKDLEINVDSITKMSDFWDKITSSGATMNDVFSKYARNINKIVKYILYKTYNGEGWIQDVDTKKVSIDGRKIVATDITKNINTEDTGTKKQIISNDVLFSKFEGQINNNLDNLKKNFSKDYFNVLVRDKKNFVYQCLAEVVDGNINDAQADKQFHDKMLAQQKPFSYIKAFSKDFSFLNLQTKTLARDNVITSLRKFVQDNLKFLAGFEDILKPEYIGDKPGQLNITDKLDDLKKKMIKILEQGKGVKSAVSEKIKQLNFIKEILLYYNNKSQYKNYIDAIDKLLSSADKIQQSNSQDKEYNNNILNFFKESSTFIKAVRSAVVDKEIANINENITEMLDEGSIIDFDKPETYDLANTKNVELSLIKNKYKNNKDFSSILDGYKNEDKSKFLLFKDFELLMNNDDKALNAKLNDTNLFNVLNSRKADSTQVDTKGNNLLKWNDGWENKTKFSVNDVVNIFQVPGTTEGDIYRKKLKKEIFNIHYISTSAKNTYFNAVKNIADNLSKIFLENYEKLETTEKELKTLSLNNIKFVCKIPQPKPSVGKDIEGSDSKLWFFIRNGLKQDNKVSLNVSLNFSKIPTQIKKSFPQQTQTFTEGTSENIQNSFVKQVSPLISAYYQGILKSIFRQDVQKDIPLKLLQEIEEFKALNANASNIKDLDKQIGQVIKAEDKVQKEIATLEVFEEKYKDFITNIKQLGSELGTLFDGYGNTLLESDRKILAECYYKYPILRHFIGKDLNLKKEIQKQQQNVVISVEDYAQLLSIKVKMSKVKEEEEKIVLDELDPDDQKWAQKSFDSLDPDQKDKFVEYVNNIRSALIFNQSLCSGDQKQTLQQHTKMRKILEQPITKDNVTKVVGNVNFCNILKLARKFETNWFKPFIINTLKTNKLRKNIENILSSDGIFETGKIFNQYATESKRYRYAFSEDENTISAFSSYKEGIIKKLKRLPQGNEKNFKFFSFKKADKDNMANRKEAKDLFFYKFDEFFFKKLFSFAYQEDRNKGWIFSDTRFGNMKKKGQLPVKMDNYFNLLQGIVNSERDAFVEAAKTTLDTEEYQAELKQFIDRLNLLLCTTKIQKQDSKEYLDLIGKIEVMYKTAFNMQNIKKYVDNLLADSAKKILKTESGKFLETLQNTKLNLNIPDLFYNFALKQIETEPEFKKVLENNKDFLDTGEGMEKQFETIWNGIQKTHNEFVDAISSDDDLSEKDQEKYKELIGKLGARGLSKIKEYKIDGQRDNAYSTFIGKPEQYVKDFEKYCSFVVDFLKKSALSEKDREEIINMIPVDEIRENDIIVPDGLPKTIGGVKPKDYIKKMTTLPPLTKIILNVLKNNSKALPLPKIMEELNKVFENSFIKGEFCCKLEKNGEKYFLTLFHTHPVINTSRFNHFSESKYQVENVELQSSTVKGLLKEIMETEIKSFSKRLTMESRFRVAQEFSKGLVELHKYNDFLSSNNKKTNNKQNPIIFSNIGYLLVPFEKFAEKYNPKMTEQRKKNLKNKYNVTVKSDKKSKNYKELEGKISGIQKCLAFKFLYTRKLEILRCKESIEKLQKDKEKLEELQTKETATDKKNYGSKIKNIDENITRLDKKIKEDEADLASVITNVKDLSRHNSGIGRHSFDSICEKIKNLCDKIQNADLNDMKDHSKEYSDEIERFVPFIQNMVVDLKKTEQEKYYKDDDIKYCNGDWGNIKFNDISTDILKEFFLGQDWYNFGWDDLDGAAKQVSDGSAAVSRFKNTINWVFGKSKTDWEKYINNYKEYMRSLIEIVKFDKHLLNSRFDGKGKIKKLEDFKQELQKQQTTNINVQDGFLTDMRNQFCEQYENELYNDYSEINITKFINNENKKTEFIKNYSSKRVEEHIKDINNWPNLTTGLFLQQDPVAVFIKEKKGKVDNILRSVWQEAIRREELDDKKQLNSSSRKVSNFRRSDIVSFCEKFNLNFHFAYATEGLQEAELIKSKEVPEVLKEPFKKACEYVEKLFEQQNQFYVAVNKKVEKQNLVREGIIEEKITGKQNNCARIIKSYAEESLREEDKGQFWEHLKIDYVGGVKKENDNLKKDGSGIMIVNKKRTGEFQAIDGEFEDDKLISAKTINHNGIIMEDIKNPHLSVKREEYNLKTLMRPEEFYDCLYTASSFNVNIDRETKGMFGIKEGQKITFLEDCFKIDDEAFKFEFSENNDMIKLDINETETDKDKLKILAHIYKSSIENKPLKVNLSEKFLQTLEQGKVVPKWVNMFKFTKLGNMFEFEKKENFEKNVKQVLSTFLKYPNSGNENIVRVKEGGEHTDYIIDREKTKGIDLEENKDSTIIQPPFSQKIITADTLVFKEVKGKTLPSVLGSTTCDFVWNARENKHYKDLRDSAWHTQLLSFKDSGIIIIDKNLYTKINTLRQHIKDRMIRVNNNEKLEQLASLLTELKEHQALLEVRQSYIQNDASINTVLSQKRINEKTGIVRKKFEAIDNEFKDLINKMVEEESKLNINQQTAGNNKTGNQQTAGNNKTGNQQKGKKNKTQTNTKNNEKDKKIVKDSVHIDLSKIQPQVEVKK